jgi:nitroreductase
MQLGVCALGVCALGLSTGWVGAFDEEKVFAILNLPKIIYP